MGPTVHLNCPCNFKSLSVTIPFQHEVCFKMVLVTTAEICFARVPDVFTPFGMHVIS